MKIKYERPETKLYQIEMEGGFCAASGDDATTDSNSGGDVTIGGENGDGHIGGDDIIFDSNWE